MGGEIETKQLTSAAILYSEYEGTYDEVLTESMIALWTNITYKFDITDSTSIINGKKAVEVLTPIVWSTLAQHKSSSFLKGYESLITTVNSFLNPKKGITNTVDLSKTGGYLTFRDNPQIQLIIEIPRVVEENRTGKEAELQDMRYDLFGNCIASALMKIDEMHRKAKEKTNKQVA